MLKTSKNMKTSILCGLFLCIVLAFALPVQAHTADSAIADIQIGKQDVTIDLILPSVLITEFDDNRDRRLSDSEITKHKGAIKQFFNSKIWLKIANQKLEAKTIQSGLEQNLPNNSSPIPVTHASILLKYDWTEPITELQMHYELFVPGVANSSCLAQVRQSNQIDNIVFTPESQNAVLINPPIFQQIISFIGLGIEHIWTGYDHILFLISLLMLGKKLRNILKVVTAFSVAHSITLFLAALNVVSIPSRLVEIAIAVSIAYIASENLWRKQAQSRWQLAFGFGLVHGLGFSSVLRELELPQTNLLTSLASFSIGIELGQFVIVIIIFLLLSYIRNFSWHLTFQRLISIGIFTMSLVWAWERAFNI